MSTIKQKKALNNLVGNGGNITKAMIDAGYSENTANTPQKLTESKGWLELMETHIPKELVAEKHKALLNKVDDKGEIDVTAVRAGVDMAHKLYGNYAPEKNINLNMDTEITNPKARELAEKYEQELKKSL